MLSSEFFCGALKGHGVNFFTGVPDSLLKDICAYITDHSDAANHVIAANEGAAVALAAGVHLSTGELPLVYLQNSGLGNLVNPLTSLADPEVYAIPMLILIGWRGEPGVHDEPQHRKQGRISPAMLDSLEVPWKVLPDEPNAAAEVLAEAVSVARSKSTPYALLVKKGTFDAYKMRNTAQDAFVLRREEAVCKVLETLSPTDVVVSTTGMTSREVFEFRARNKAGHARDFLTVGCMGHASQIAMGIALRKADRRVYCLDGDGAVLMHMGSLAVTGTSGLKNFKHIVINNGAHDSVGGQPTVGLKVDLPAVAKSSGYMWVKSASQPDEISALLAELQKTDGPALLEIKVNRGARKDLGRPTTTTLENKRDFMANLGVQTAN